MYANLVKQDAREYVPEPLTETERARLILEFNAARDAVADAEIAFNRARREAADAVDEIGIAVRKDAARVGERQQVARAAREVMLLAQDALRIANNKLEELKAKIRYDQEALTIAASRAAADTNGAYPVDERGHLLPDALDAAISKVTIAKNEMEFTVEFLPGRKSGTDQSGGFEYLGPLGNGLKGDAIALRALAAHVRAGGDRKPLQRAGIPIG